jgi:hypothetical protein
MTIALSVGVEVVGDGLDHAPPRPPAAGIAALAHRLETAGVSYWVLGAERGERPVAPNATLDPTLIATVGARHSTDLGLVVASAAHRDHPYNLARRLLSADHAARGRLGWLALDFDHGTALNAATDTWSGADLAPAHTSDAVDAVRTLWRTWPLESVVGDRTTGLFADATQIRRADVTRGYSIAGPLNVPGSRQGDLPVWRQWTPGDAASTRGADLLVVEEGDELPDDGSVVIRLRSPHRIGSALERIAQIDRVVGVVIRVESIFLTTVLDGVLPAARRRGLIDDPSAGTLRDRLGLPVSATPDVASHAPAFNLVPNPGGRL